MTRSRYALVSLLLAASAASATPPLKVPFTVRSEVTGVGPEYRLTLELTANEALEGARMWVDKLPEGAGLEPASIEIGKVAYAETRTGVFTVTAADAVGFRARGAVQATATAQRISPTQMVTLFFGEQPPPPAVDEATEPARSPADP